MISHEVTRYEDGTLAVIWDDSVVSINLTAYDLPVPTGNQFYVKDYSEHEGLAEAMERAGFAFRTHEVRFGPFNSRGYLMELVTT